DLLEHVGRLAGVFHLCAVDRLFLLDGIGRDVLAPDPPRIRGRDVHRDFLDQVAEVVGPRYEIRLTVDLDEDADAATHVDVAADDTLGRRTAGLLRRLRETALPQQRRGLFHVAVRLCE